MRFRGNVGYLPMTPESDLMDEFAKLSPSSAKVFQDRLEAFAKMANYVHCGHKNCYVCQDSYDGFVKRVIKVKQYFLTSRRWRTKWKAMCRVLDKAFGAKTGLHNALLPVMKE
jgi:predicted molibdopterin-dependent oxidoreductase YjgC